MDKAISLILDYVNKAAGDVSSALDVDECPKPYLNGKLDAFEEIRRVLQTLKSFSDANTSS